MATATSGMSSKMVRPPTGSATASIALRFIPKEDLAKEGYGEYLRLFE
jgi:hypothetical protein